MDVFAIRCKRKIREKISFFIYLPIVGACELAFLPFETIISVNRLSIV